MAQLSRPTSAIVGLWLSSLIVGFGCHVIAGIEDRTSVDGTGGASSSSSGSSSSGVGLLMCQGNGAQPYKACSQFDCMASPDTTTSECACGGCPNDCGGAGCANSTCNVQRMALVSYFAYGMATNGDAVFWASIDEVANHSLIYRLEFDAVDKVNPQIIGETDGLVRLIVADCDYVYMAVTGITKETIRKVPVNAAAPEMAVDIVEGMTAVGVNAMEVDQEYVYFSYDDSNKKEVQAWHKGDGVTKVASTFGRVTGLQRRDNYLYWADFGDETHPGQILRSIVPKLGLAWNTKPIRENAGSPYGLTVDDSAFYWIDLQSINVLGNLRKAPLVAPGVVEGPDLPVAKVNAQSAPSFPANWLIGDAKYLYFIDVDAGGVGFIARTDKKAGPGPATTIASNVNVNSNVAFNAFSLISDAERVYISAPGDPMSGSNVLWVSK